MAAISLTSPKRFLGAKIPSVKVLSSAIDVVITKVNTMSTTASTLLANIISPVTSGGAIAFTSAIVEKHTASAINVSATATGAQLATGLVTSTSAAAVALTLPSAAELLAAIGGAIGTSFDLIVDNSAGANTVTVTASASITAATAVVTGGATLTVASGATGIFRIYFPSATVAKIYRVG